MHVDKQQMHILTAIHRIKWDQNLDHLFGPHIPLIFGRNVVG